jgi:NADH:ubiquinone oxidoreductase subunit 5 (subunit L)/multisubunit Na+/H+ antiporter MnhA subunit
LTVATLNYVFVVVCLFIARPVAWRAPWWAATALVAALSIAGVPGTLGFIVRQQTISGLVQSNNAVWLVGDVIAETLLMAATFRLIITPREFDLPTGAFRRLSFVLGSLAVALPLIALPLSAGWLPLVPSLSGLFSRLNPVGWLMWLAPIVLGGLLAWRGPRAAESPIDSDAAPLWVSALRLDWLSAVLAFVMQRLTDVLRGLASVIEGEGGLIWAIIIVIVGLVLSSGSLK